MKAPPRFHERSPIPTVGVVALPERCLGADSVGEFTELLNDVRIPTELDIPKRFCLGADAADGEKVEGTVAAAPHVFDSCHRFSARLTLAARAFGNLPLGTLRDPAFAHWKSTAQKPPQPLTKDDLLLGRQNRVGGKGGAKLSDESRLISTRLRAIGTRGAFRRSVAIRTTVGGFERNLKPSWVLDAVKQKVQDAPGLVLYRQARIAKFRKDNS